MSSDKLCPKCGLHKSGLLATTNEWRWYCPECDIRFNDRDEILESTCAS